MHGTITNPHAVKLFIGMLSQDIHLLDEIKEKLKKKFGHSDLQSPVWPWEHTEYYRKEMGTGLKRQFIFFQRLIKPETISGVKLETIEIERQYLNENNNPPFPPLPLNNEGQRGDYTKEGMEGFKGGRRINLDPGYLDSAKVVLVSTKDFSHRIYLGNGIYGEVTLFYSGRAYRIFPYTFPDFRTREYLNIFKNARELYKANIKNH